MVRERWSRAARLGAVSAALAIGVGACSSGAGSDATSTDRPGQEAAAVSSGFEPAGAAMADGLLVPKETRLAGTVFRRPAGSGGRDDWSAYLVVDGDPFAAWDDLADQARTGRHPAELAGSADACTWTWPDDVPPPGDDLGGMGEPLVTRPIEGSATTTTTEAPPTVDPYVEAVTITATAPLPDVDGVECSASATAVIDGSNVRYTAHLRSGARWPATITIQATSGEGDLSAAPTAWRTTLEMQSRRGGGPDLVPGPGRVPEAAADHVPEAAEQPVPKAGGPFGTEVNCFVEDGYRQLRLPPQTAFAAGGFDDGTASVIAVDDAEAAIADIQQQTAGDGTSEDGSGSIKTLELADGGEVTEFAFSIGAGGGGCSATTSRDGRFVLVSVHGD